MKVFKTIYTVWLSTLVLIACQKEENNLSETGILTLQKIVQTEIVKSASFLKSTSLTTSVDDYWVYIYQDDLLLEGYPVQYADLPEEIELSVGSYGIVASGMMLEKVVLPTRDVNEGFYYAGETSVTIKADETSPAEVVASQAVASVVVQFSDKFKQTFSPYAADVSGIIFDETNTDEAYYEAGDPLQLILTYTDGGEEKTRNFQTSKAVEAGDEWTLSFDAVGELVTNGSGAIAITVSTDTTPQEENWDIETGDSPDDAVVSTEGDGTEELPYTVADARAKQDGTTAWVQGYIVGYIKSSSTVTTNWEESSDTNIAIADEAGETAIAKMLFVKLDSSGSARSTLGLASTQGQSLGMLVKLKGTLETYYSSCGLTGVNQSDEYVIVE
jgi:hypothetical protein